ncbi:MAG: small basic protein [Planctomycetes bacterium]|nr:small basic protein [Planctomycetota bacterium]
MSIHRSLTSNSKLERQRNVLKRSERIEKLEDEGHWAEGDPVFGLPTTKVVKARSAKKKMKKEEEEEGTATEETSGKE